ncbi:MAG: WYL domain-containing protein [Treponema sp.]|nr:WYL domain-containing protein [Treponema sp.]
MFRKRVNALFQIAAELYNASIIQNRLLKPDEIKKAFKAAPYEPVEVDKFLKKFMQEDYGRIGYGMFVKTGSGYRPAMPIPVPTVFSRDEAAWIRTMLDDEKIGLFLEDGTRKKLCKAFEGSEPLYRKKDVFIQRNAARQDFADKNLQRIFKTVLDGIADKKLIRFEYLGRKGAAPAAVLTALPLKIYYHGVNDSFQCIAFNTAQKKKMTLNIERITSAAIIENLAADFRELPADSAEIAEIELRNEKNIPTQCFMLLSDYQKTAIYDDARNIYKIAIRYYEFERQDLLKNLLSLGAYCTILSPGILVEQIKRRLEKLGRLQQEPVKISN